MSCGYLDESWGIGSMSSREVAGLAGATTDQLRRWRRSGTVSATALPPRRGKPCAYRWDEFQRARLAVLLLQHGLKPRRLKTVLNEYRDVLAHLPELPTATGGRQAMVKQSDTTPHTGKHPQPCGWFDFVMSAPLAESGAPAAWLGRLPQDVTPEGVLSDFRSGCPLGRLQHYADFIDVRPEVLGGSPTLKGTRLQTLALSSSFEAGDTVSAIADAYNLSTDTVRRAIAFDAALDAYASAA